MLEQRLTEAIVNALMKDFFTEKDLDFPNIIDYIRIFHPSLRLTPAKIVLLKTIFGLELDDKDPKVVVRDMLNERTLYRLTEKQFLEYLYDEGFSNVREPPSNPPQEVLIVGGRRGGKTTLCALIEEWTFGKLLAMYDPHKFFNISPDSSIKLVSIANSEKQAHEIYDHIAAAVSRIPYYKRFKVKTLKSEIRAHTRKSLKEHGENSQPLVFVQPLASSTITGRGRNIVLLELDEFAFFRSSKKIDNAENVWNMLVLWLFLHHLKLKDTTLKSCLKKEWRTHKNVLSFSSIQH